MGVRFKRLIMDSAETDRSPSPPERPDVERLIFCSGKIYYELEAQREAEGKQGKIAICRVEQLAPFPFDLVMRELRRYPNAQVRHCGLFVSCADDACALCSCGLARGWRAFVVGEWCGVLCR